MTSKFPFNLLSVADNGPRPSPHVDSKTHVAIPHPCPPSASRQKLRKVTRAVNSCIPANGAAGAFPIFSDDLLTPASGATRHVNFVRGQSLRTRPLETILGYSARSSEGDTGALTKRCR